jgi:serine/threonine protein kinase
VLTDFGISSITDQSVKSIMTTVQHGNVRWNSPELMFEEGAEPSCGSDIWAFGMVAIEVLSKDIPFQNIVAEGAVLLYIHRGNRPRRPDGVDDGLWSLITKCWHDVPSQRITATQLETELKALLRTRKPPTPKRTKAPQLPFNLRKIADYKAGFGIIEIASSEIECAIHTDCERYSLC